MGKRNRPSEILSSLNKGYCGIYLLVYVLMGSCYQTPGLQRSSYLSLLCGTMDFSYYTGSIAGFKGKQMQKQKKSQKLQFI
jgi:hypothetical protein